jgi:hypothetical protein
LTIEGQNALTVQGTEPFVTISDLKGEDVFPYRLQSAHGNFGLFQGNRSSGQIAFGWIPRLAIKDNGNIGIGVADPQTRLHVAGSFLRVDGAGNEQAYIGGDGAGGDVQLGSSNPGITNVALWNSASNSRMNLFVKSLVVTGGADFAENFEVTNTLSGRGAFQPKAEPGMVVSIDPAMPGKLTLSTQAYDHLVAGIISGAGGIRPGMTMSQDNLVEGQFPVALSGRVYCWVDATQDAVEPGDLLTTSSTSGYAMKAADAVKAQGAIIGKAMTGLKEGKGLVLVLVTLQ